MREIFGNSLRVAQLLVKVIDSKCLAGWGGKSEGGGRDSIEERVRMDMVGVEWRGQRGPKGHGRISTHSFTTSRSTDNHLD